jgi:hypothetical protein
MGVTFIFGPVENGPPPAVENAICISSFLRHARVLKHWTPEWRREFHGGKKK